MNDRLRCCVPFCRRTFKSKETDTETIEVMCGDHWRMTSKIQRQRRAKILRKLARLDAAWCEGKPTAPLYRLSNLQQRLWLRIKKQAIERAGGL